MRMVRALVLLVATGLLAAGCSASPGSETQEPAPTASETEPTAAIDRNFCPEDEGGAIDASTFVDSNGLHLVWKNDGNCCGLDTWISTAPLSADGLSIAGREQKLIMQTLDWEGDLVEAPTVFVRDSTYVMLYSANSYGDDRYATGLATAPALDGPWTKADQPFLSSESSDGLYRGPGGQDIVIGDDGDTFLAFHSWDPAYTYRAMHIVPIAWDGAIPRPVLE